MKWKIRITKKNTRNILTRYKKYFGHKITWYISHIVLVGRLVWRSPYLNRLSKFGIHCIKCGKLMNYRINFDLLFWRWFALHSGRLHSFSSSSSWLSRRGPAETFLRPFVSSFRAPPFLVHCVLSSSRSSFSVLSPHLLHFGPCSIKERNGDNVNTCCRRFHDHKECMFWQVHQMSHKAQKVMTLLHCNWQEL